MTDVELKERADVAPAWPEDQVLTPLDEPSIVLTHFADAVRYHPGLIAHILELAKGSPFTDARFPGGCGLKIRHLAQWRQKGASLLEARALELFRRVSGHAEAVVDSSWASVYGHGEYCMPHSHTRAAGSVVYLLDPGDDVPEDVLGGKLAFADPRMACCCQIAPGHMTNLLVPSMRAGSMIIFPAAAIHTVAPYHGHRPRITLSWNIAQQALPGKPMQGRAN